MKTIQEGYEAGYEKGMQEGKMEALKTISSEFNMQFTEKAQDTIWMNKTTTVWECYEFAEQNAKKRLGLI